MEHKLAIIGRIVMTRVVSSSEKTYNGCKEIGFERQAGNLILKDLV